MAEQERWFSPAETAERLGVTPKALRVYERAGLVKPLRTHAGWRAYGPDQMARLHQVLALKRLGLPLKRVGELLVGRLESLDAVLALQQQVLEARRGEVEKGLALLARARAHLASGQTLTPDGLTQLTRETVMTEKLNDEEMAAVFKPLADKHFTLEEQAQVSARKDAHFADPTAISRAWDEVIAQAEAAMAKGDPASPEAAAVAERWMGLVDQFTGGDPTINAKSAALWKDAFDSDVAPRLPFSKEIWTFIGEANRRRMSQMA